MKHSLLVATIIVAGGFALPCRAQDAAGSAAEAKGLVESSALNFAMFQEEPARADDHADDWRVLFNSWIWLMGIEGDVGARGLTTDVDASFTDILDASDSIVALSGRLEIARGRVGGFVDGLYSKLGVEDVTIDRPNIHPDANIDFQIDLGAGPFNPNPDPDPNPELSLGLLPTEIDITMELAVVDFGVMYRFCEWPLGEQNGVNDRLAAVDGYVGARYTLLTVEIDPAEFESREMDRDFFDPIVGLRLVAPFAEHWQFAVWGDVGGFGVSSDFTWSATGVLGYQFTLFDLPATVHGGYRAIGWEYEDGSGSDKFVWDVTLHGPIIGFSVIF